MNTDELFGVAKEAAKGKPTNFLRLRKGADLSPDIEEILKANTIPVYSRELQDSVELQIGKDEAERTRKLREENQDYRQKVERLAIALLNKESMEATAAHWQKEHEIVHERLKRLEGLLGNFQSELANQKATQVRALQDKYGNGPTA